MRHTQKQSYQGLGAIAAGMAALFVLAFVGFSAFKGEDVPLPVLNDQSEPAVTTTPSPTPTPTPQASPQTGLSLVQRLFAWEIPSAIAVPLEDEHQDTAWAMEEPPQENVATGPSATIAPLVPAQGTGPRIMLYSTHSNESFRKLPDQDYQEANNSRTLNSNYSILKVNSTLSNLLSEKYHLPIFFDNTDHEQGKYYTTSYNRSLKSIEAAKKKYDTLAVFFDIHRDAMGSSGIGDTVTVDGKPCAKIMFVVGTGEGKTGNGFREKPNWQSNKQFAEAIVAELNKIAPGIARGVRVKTGRYNQHVSDHALAIEMGHNQNTLEEVLNSVPYLAQAIATVATRDLDIQPVSVP